MREQEKRRHTGAPRPVVLALLALLSVTAGAQVAVTAAPDMGWNADSAARVIVSDWLKVSNARFNGSADPLSCKAIGEFHCGSFMFHPHYNLNIPSGILMCTGDVENAIGPYMQTNDPSVYMQDVGCQPLADSSLMEVIYGLLQEVQQHMNSIEDTTSEYYIHLAATIPPFPFFTNWYGEWANLEFDVVPCSESVSVRYVFGSHKYNEFSAMTYGILRGECLSSFGLFVSGPKPGGGRYENTNVALLPGTDTPISVETLHKGNISYPLDLDYNTEYLAPMGSPYLTYGCTIPITATVALIPDSTYTFRFSLGEDRGLTDCAVFVELDSFKPTRRQSFEINGEPLSVLPEWKNYCVFDEVVFTPHTGLRYGHMKWDFGDGTSAVGDTVTHIYTTPGIYTVKNVIYNASNPSDTMCVEYDIDIRDIVTTYHYEEACIDYMWYKTENGVVVDSVLLTESGTYSDTLLQVNWCDSITNLELHLLFPQAADVIYGEPNMALPTEYMNGTFIHYVDEIEGVFGYDWELETDCGWVLSKYPQLGITSPRMCKVTVTEEGSGILRAVTENCCGKAYLEKHLTASPLDIGEHSASVLSAYPNPTDGTFTIVADDIRTVEVFNQMGQRVLADRSGSRTINADGLPAGIYFLKVETATATKYGKLMKK